MPNVFPQIFSSFPQNSTTERQPSESWRNSPFRCLRANDIGTASICFQLQAECASGRASWISVAILTPLGNRMLVAIWQWQSGNGTGWRFGARDDRHDRGPGMPALKRIAQPADVASVVAFLASDEVGHRQGLWRSAPRTAPGEGGLSVLAQSQSRAPRSVPKTNSPTILDLRRT
jgi:hypothetical protein